MATQSQPWFTSIAPIRSALLVALLQTPHRFRTKRQLWAYSGLAVQTYDSGEYRFVRGKNLAEQFHRGMFAAFPQQLASGCLAHGFETIQLLI